MTTLTPHVFKGINTHQKDFKKDEAIQECKEWIINEFATRNCMQLFGRQTVTASGSYKSNPFLM